MEEVLWKVLIEKPNYSVSNTGEVRNDRSGKTLKAYIGESGYPMIRFSDSAFTVHSLVAKNWLCDSYFDGAQVDHLDMDKTNNVVSNLEWVTPKENSRRAREVYSVQGENNPQAVITEQDVRYIKYGSFDKTNSDLANELSIGVGVVERVRRGDRWLHVVDAVLDAKLATGEISYPKGKCANLNKDVRESIALYIASGHGEKECVSKFGINRSTFYRIKKSLITM